LAESVRLRAGLLEHPLSLGAGVLERLCSFVLRSLEESLRRVRSFSRLLMLVRLRASLLEHARSLGTGLLERLDSFLLRALEESLRRVRSFSRLLVLALEVLAHALELELARLDLAAAATRLVVSTPKLLGSCISCLALNPVGELDGCAYELEGLLTSCGAV
jgi:hypothetical protein